MCISAGINLTQMFKLLQALWQLISLVFMTFNWLKSTKCCCTKRDMEQKLIYQAWMFTHTYITQKIPVTDKGWYETEFYTKLPPISKVKNVWSYVSAPTHSQFFPLYFSCCCLVSWGCCFCAVAIKTTLACHLVSGCSLLRWGYIPDNCHVDERTEIWVVHSVYKWLVWWDSYSSVDEDLGLFVC
jgi:hypothetical protein